MSAEPEPGPEPEPEPEPELEPLTTAPRPPTLSPPLTPSHPSPLAAASSPRRNFLLCHDTKLQLYNFSGVREREWTLDSVIKYIKLIGGPAGREGIVLGLDDGKCYKIFIDNPFPVCAAAPHPQPPTPTPASPPPRLPAWPPAQPPPTEHTTNLG